MVPSTRRLAKVGALAAVYAVLTVIPPLNAAGYGPVQVRVSEALAILPFIYPWAPWGLYLGCILANIGSPFLMWDISLGALTTLLAAHLARRVPRPYLAPLPAVILNAAVIPIYVAPLSGLPYLPVALYVALGQAVACYGLGYPLLLYLLSNDKVRGALE